MKKRYLFFGSCFLNLMFFNFLNAQNVAINNTKLPANESAMLDISSDAKGLLIPRVSLTGLGQAAPLTSPATSLLVFNTNAALPQGMGYYYNSGSAAVPVWIKLVDGIGASGWLLTGNAGTNPVNNFIGTNDDKNVILKRGGVNALELYPGGTILARGSANGISPTAASTEPGKKLLWIPSKAAVRIGGIENMNAASQYWKDENIGEYSFAVGKDVAAVGAFSLAIGDKASSSWLSAIAIGTLAAANGEGSISIGLGTGSSGVASIAMGFETYGQDSGSVALGILSGSIKKGSTAIGYDCHARGVGSVAMGYQSTVDFNRDFSMAFGYNAKATGFLAALAMGNNAFASGITSVSIGDSTTAAGNKSVSIGYYTKANADYSVALGNGNRALGIASTAIGNNTIASAFAATAMGSLTKASGNLSTALGSDTESYGNVSTAMGKGTIAEAYASLAIGKWNDISENPDPENWLPTDKAFQIGNGAGNVIRTDALFIRYNGDMTIAGKLTENSDIRFKKNILPLDNVLSKIATIQPISYNFKEGTNHSTDRQIGFSAQEIEKQFPELVSKDGKGYLSVGYSNMSAVLMQAIKEQQQQYVEMKEEYNQKINVLQQQNQTLLKKLELLEQKINK